MPVENGDKILVHYTGTLEDGTVFDSSEKHGKPLECEVGQGMLIKGFEQALLGMNEGEEKEIKLTPTEAYGDHNPELIKPVPKAQLPQGQEIKEGMILLMQLPTGQQVPTKIAEVGETEVKIDMNHPLAGKTLIFKLKLEKITAKGEAEKKE